MLLKNIKKVYKNYYKINIHKLFHNYYKKTVTKYHNFKKKDRQQILYFFIFSKLPKFQNKI